MKKGLTIIVALAVLAVSACATSAASEDCIAQAAVALRDADDWLLRASDGADSPEFRAEGHAVSETLDSTSIDVCTGGNNDAIEASLGDKQATVEAVRSVLASAIDSVAETDDAGVEATTTTTEPPLTTYVMTVQLYDEDTLRELTSAKCAQKTGIGEPYDNVPSATYSLVDQGGDAFGILFPDGNVGTCTFQYSVEMDPADMPDLLLVRGPRMQQNGFPARKADFTENDDGSLLMLDLSLGVDLSY